MQVLLYSPTGPPHADSAASASPWPAPRPTSWQGAAPAPAVRRRPPDRPRPAPPPRIRIRERHAPPVTERFLQCLRQCQPERGARVPTSVVHQEQPRRGTGTFGNPCLSARTCSTSSTIRKLNLAPAPTSGRPRPVTPTHPLQHNPNVQVVACGNGGGGWSTVLLDVAKCGHVGSRGHRDRVHDVQPVAGQPDAERPGRLGLQHAHLAPVQHLLLGRQANDQNSPSWTRWRSPWTATW